MLLLEGIKGTLHAEPALRVVKNVATFFRDEVGSAASFTNVLKDRVQRADLSHVDSCGGLHCRHVRKATLLVRSVVPVDDSAEGLGECVVRIRLRSRVKDRLGLFFHWMSREHFLTTTP